MKWKLITFTVCCLGFFKNLRPSNPYLTPYLTGQWKNLTETQVNHEIYPWWTYSYVVWMIPVFLVTDFLRYKPILILDSVAHASTWALLLWGQGVPAIRLAEVVYGLATACNIQYQSYLFAVVSDKNFKKVASFSRAASLIGKFVSSALSQVFVSLALLDYFQLHLFSFASMIVACLLTLILPRARHSELIKGMNAPVIKEKHTIGAVNPENGHIVDQNGNVNEKHTHTQRETKKSVKQKIIFVINELKAVYSSRTVLIWSIWWSLTTCANLEVGNYVQNLWDRIAPHESSQHRYNGAVEAAGTLISSISVLLIGYLPVDWSVRGRSEGLMAVICAVNAAVLIVMGNTTDIWVAYALYDVFRTTYQVIVTIASHEIAFALDGHSYGFVFGCNTFIALALEAILAASVVDQAGLDVDIRTQFGVYGGIFVITGVIFVFVFLAQVFGRSRKYMTEQSVGGNENKAFSDIYKPNKDVTIYI